MFTLNIRNIVTVGRGSIKWEIAQQKGPSDSKGDSKDPLTEAKELLKKIREANFSKSTELQQLQELLKKTGKINDDTSKDLKSLLVAELAKPTRTQSEWDERNYTNPTDGDKKDIQKLLQGWENDFNSVDKKNQDAKSEVLKTTNTQLTKIDKEVLVENADFVKKFGNRVNLGAVVPFIEKQSGASTKEKIQIAFNKAKSNTTRSDAGESAINIDDEYQMKSKLSGKGNHLAEYNALTSLLESMVKSQAVFDNLKSQNIPEDKKVDPNSLVELFADFDDDGVIEAVNGVNDAGLWNKFKGLFTDLDGAQKEYLGEHQAKNKMKNDIELLTMLDTIGIKQNEGEDIKVFAKRARAALLMSASVSGTADIDPTKALHKMQKNEKYKEERGNIEKQIADLQKNITDKIPNIKAEDANKLARSLASIVTTYTTSIGVGSANVDRIMQELGTAVTSPKGNATIIGIDLGVMAKVVNTERFKVGLGAGLGGGVSSEGVFAFAHVGAEGKLTIIDKSSLEELKKNDGNITATLGLHAGMDLRSFNIVPAITLDALWNDKIDSLDNALLKMNTILDKLTVVGENGKVKLDLSKVPGKLDPILLAQLNSLAHLMESVDPKMTNNQQAAHAILMRDRFMQSFKVFMASQPEFKGFSLAGIRFAVVPGAFLLGPVFQDISVERIAKAVQGEKRKAEKTERADYMKEFGLSWDSKTRVLTRDESNLTKIVLTDELAWDEKDAKVTFPEGTMPKFTIDTGISNTLGGRGEKTIIVSMDKSTTSKESGTIDVKVEKLASKESLPQGTLEMIQALPINKLIERRDVQRFMKVMTLNPTDYNKVANAAFGVKEFQKIITAADKSIPKEITGAERQEKLISVAKEIDEKLVGDVVTRNFNVAKNDSKAFAEYKKLLLARGAKLPKGFSQESMKIGDIAGVSFDKKGLRDQEINIIAKATGIDAQKLKSADKEMIQAISGSETLATEGSGYMSMARNRKTVQGSRGYETGSYIKKQDLGLSPSENIAAIQKGMKNDLVKVALTNLAGRPEFVEYKDLIGKVDSSKLSIDKDGKATVSLGDNKTLTIDLSHSKVSSALYGDTKMTTAEQAVCVNVAVLYEPTISGTIVDEGKMVGAPEMDITDNETVMLPEVSANQIAPLAAVARKGGGNTSGKNDNVETKPGDGGEVPRPVTPQPVVNPGTGNPGVTPPSVNPGTVDSF